ncbi:hypothetical protein V6N13_137979 [Hibiscus sabdariffa]
MDQLLLELGITDWVVSNLDGSVAFAREPTNWDLMFVATLWNLWLARNAKVFNVPRLEESSVIGRSSQLGLAYWEPPPSAWIKLNTGGAWRESNGYARCGGVERNNTGTSFDSLEPIFYTTPPDSLLHALPEDSLRFMSDS